MERYQNGKIYKIVCNITGKVYIGSTCKKLLSQRLAGHVQSFKRWKNGKIHDITSFRILEGNDYYIELLELVPCNSKDELLIKERFYIQSIECVNKHKNLVMTEEDKKEWQKKYREVNKDKKKEYNEKNKDKNIEYMKEYNEKNKEDKKEYMKEYNGKNKDKMKEYYENNKDKIKEYREKNKDKLKEQKKEWYENKKLLNNSL